MTSVQASYDVVVVGAGPVGSVAALAHARQGASVLLLEANPKAAGRFAGEWLHPPAVEMLGSLDIPLPESGRTGHGFVVFPDDSCGEQVLPYADDTTGLSCEHHELVGAIRGTACAHPNVDYLEYAKVTAIENQRVTVARKKERDEIEVLGGRIVGADGRASIVRSTLGLPVNHMTSSRMAGLVLTDVDMPNEGLGHVFLGGPGPVLAYRIAPNSVRMCIDVPLWSKHVPNRYAWMYESYGPILPPSMRHGFEATLRQGKVAWAANQVRPRVHYGRGDMALVGDAVGHHHPMTATGMTLGFGDALELAESPSFEAYRKRRLAATRVPEVLAVALYEVFADSADETVAMRRAVYSMWRRSEAERVRTMRFLACQDVRPPSFAYSFLLAMGEGALELGREALRSRDVGTRIKTATKLAQRVRFLGSGLLKRPTTVDRLKERAHNAELTAALNVSVPVADIVDLNARKHGAEAPVDTAVALERAAAALVGHQAADGDWEGEVVWNAMLSAQYVMMCHVTGTQISDARRERLLLHFERTRLHNGLWGMHAQSEPYLFVTALVYVAARLLGVDVHDPMLLPARRFFAAEGGVLGIPSWGKFWLAMLNLYDWEGVNALVPETWLLPERVPLHPSNYYCHARLIYMAMACIYASKLQAPVTPLIESLRSELFPQRWERVNWGKARNQLRDGDVVTPHTPWLKALYRVSRAVEKHHSKRLRARVVDDLKDRIRWELRSSDYSSISPVSGLLNIIALWHDDPADRDVARALERLSSWIWEDDIDGTRVVGARSGSWDSAFALHALAAARPHVRAEQAIERGTTFLRSQQIQHSFAGYASQYRVDPQGGWCFAGVWNGWPASDCTAEAMLGILETQADPDEAEMAAGARFVLRCQNGDGGFGSYEASRLAFKLEWLNPVEMFGNSMTEHSYVECTASCISALAAFRHRFPEHELVSKIDEAIESAQQRLRYLQESDGSWKGAWGVHYLYGTMFGVRGLLAAGAGVQDPSVQKAVRWLLARQRHDGGWGEHHKSCVKGAYTEHHESQVTQTAWALTTLLEAECADWPSLQRAANWLARTQQADGQWPKQDMTAIFFDTALLDYTLYRCYFPVQALGLYESRRRRRQAWGAERMAKSRARRAR